MPPRFVYRPIYWFRNIFQYVLGTVFYFLIYGIFSISQFALGLLGFLIAYNAVYFINDLIDYKDDKKNKINSYKPLVKKTINFRQAKLYAVLSLLVGISIAFSVNEFYGFIILSLISLNILHSFLRKKFRLKVLNLFLIQTIKYSTGWFALTLSLSGFPLWIIFSMSTVYVLTYFLYKNNLMLKYTISRNKIFFLLLSGFGMFSYVFSIMVSPFKLPLVLIFFILLFPVLLCFKFKNSFERIKIGGFSSQISLFIFILLFLILTVPSVAEINEKISMPIDEIRNNVREMTPAGVIRTIDEFEESVTLNLENTICNVSKISHTLYYR